MTSLVIMMTEIMNKVDKEMLLKQIHDLCDKHECSGYVLADTEFKTINIDSVQKAKVIDYEICTIKNHRPKYYHFGYIKYGQEDLGQRNHVLCMIVDKEV